MKKTVRLLALLISVMVMSTTTAALASDTNSCIWVRIDIKPWSCPNSINLGSKGKVPVAVLTYYDDPDYGDFDASTVDPETVVFAGAQPVHWAIEDVDYDGDMDLILHFKTQELDPATFYVDQYGTWATLTGYTYGSDCFQSNGIVNIVPKVK